MFSGRFPWIWYQFLVCHTFLEKCPLIPRYTAIIQEQCIIFAAVLATLMIIQMIFSFSSASNVMVRHKLLLETIGGVFDEEEHAYTLATEFSWILPTVIIFGGLFDLILIMIYMKFAHPWKDILSQEKVTQTDKDGKRLY